MATSIKTRDLPDHVAANAVIRARRKRLAEFQGLPFESMSSRQKDAALKELLIRAKMIPET